MFFKNKFGNRNLNKIYSALNLTITYIKPVTFNNTTFFRTLFLVGYLEKDIQDIQDIRKNIQYQEIGGLFTLKITFLQKLDV